MPPTKDTLRPEENANVHPQDNDAGARKEALEGAYGNDQEGTDEAQAAQRWIERLNRALEMRERWTLISNGLQYSRAYLYNQQKAINYAPPRDVTDDRNVSMGIVHTKIIRYISLFIKFFYRTRIKCYDETGAEIDGLGDIYNLGIQFTRREELFEKKMALILWEAFTQGDAFMLEEFESLDVNIPKAMLNGVAVGADKMEYTYEFFSQLKFEPGETIQKQRAVTRVLDGRMVIFGNPEIEEVQEQPLVCVEMEIDRAFAEALYGTLPRWKSVPNQRQQIDRITPEKITLFGVERLANPGDKLIAHFVFDRFNNKLNLFLNGLMMLNRDTPMTLMYPRGNYPLSHMPTERLKGSIYSRGVPAKLKFTADWLDWALKNVSLKFEQGVVPAILAKGKYTLSRAMFRAGAVTYGVTPDDYAMADPNAKGVQPNDTGFMEFIQAVLDDQTFKPTDLSDIPANSPALGIGIADQNQRDQLAFLLDGICCGMLDMALRRAETIESKYMNKQKEVMVNGKKENVYRNWTINAGVVSHSVVFDDALGDPEYEMHGTAHKKLQSKLFQKSFQARKNGKRQKFYIADPDKIRKGQHSLHVEIIPERIRETDLQMEIMWDEFDKLIATFGANVNMDELKNIYLETRGRPASIFNSADAMKLQQIQQAGAMQTFGQPNAPVATMTPSGTPGGGNAAMTGQPGTPAPTMLARPSGGRGTKSKRTILAGRRGVAGRTR